MDTYTATEFTACNLRNRFTRAELETLAWMAEGKENAVIGAIRGHGEPGAKKLASQVMHKLQCNNRCLAISRAFAAGYLKSRQASLQIVAAALIIISGISAATGNGDAFLRTASSRGQGTYRVRWEDSAPANLGGAA